MADQPAQPSEQLAPAPPAPPPVIADSDPGLQDFMRHVYNTMCLGCIITGSVGFLISHMPSVQAALFSFPMFFVTIFAPVAFVWFGFTPDRVMHMMAEKVSFIFALYSAVMGISMSCVFWFLSQDSIARVFFVVAAAFAATSYYGLSMKRNVGNMESAVIMAAAGVILAFLGNFLMHATKLYYIVSIVGVLAFTGIAVWETHVLKEAYALYKDEKGAKDRLAIGGALLFYLTFIGIFQYILNFGWAQGGARRR
jgi:FtsH-binding integral membrane protein